MLSILRPAAAMLLATAAPLFAQSASISVNASSEGVRIGSMHYGIFYEELNHAGNGGLWAELIKNRSFEDGNPLDAWTKLTTGGAAGTLTTDTNSPLNTYNKTEAAVSVTAIGTGSCGLYNSGFYTMPVVSNSAYKCVIYARKAAGFTGNLGVRIEDATGAASDTQVINNASLSTNWNKFAFVLTGSRTLSAARLAITTQSTGTFYLTYVSLMPGDAVDGFRPDLLQKLEELKPAFVRFPGGSYVDGGVLAEGWNWKAALGSQESRRTHWDLWGYWDNNALGLFEYLLLCEKLGAEPLVVVNCGMAQQESVQGAAVLAYVQDALDAIEFADGDATTTLGSQRAAMGHSAPFSLKYMEIGNENGGDVYNTNYTVFYNSIKAAYPAMNLIANVWGGIPTSAPVDIMDEHAYNSPEWFAQNAHIYDSYSRSGPKVYVGEFAVTQGGGLGNLAGGLGEAMWMLGTERNADIVRMCSYAPLFVNVNNRSWSPDLIDFDASTSYGIPSYYVQKMMFNNRGDINLATAAAGPAKTVDIPSGGVGVGTWLTQAEYDSVTVTNSDGTVLYQSNFTNNTTGWSPGVGTWRVVNGCLQQTDRNTADCRDYYYAPAWTNYTLTCRARKISGNEGFFVMFRVKDAATWYSWNIGGWGNTRSAVERSLNGSRSEASLSATNTVQTNLWYDAKVVVQDKHFQCYLRWEGQTNYALIHDFTESASYPGFDALATREESTGNILLKVVNRTYLALTNTPIAVTNTGWPLVKATVTTLSSASDLDENTLASPTNVSPVQTQFSALSAPFNYTLQPYSLTIFRLAPDLDRLATITATAGTGGSIAPQGAVLVVLHSNQTFTVTPSANYVLTNIFVDGAWVGPVSNYTFADVAANHTISAAFAPITRVITASAGAGGSVSPFGPVTVNQGTSATFRFTPNPGLMVDKVYVDSVPMTPADSYTFNNVQSDHTLSVTFRTRMAHTITATAGTNGVIGPAGAIEVLDGWNQTFLIDPDFGSGISSVTVDGISKGALSVYTFTNVTGDHTIAASFSNGAPPVAWYKFDETSGTTASDSSGYGKDATLVGGPVWTAGKYANGIKLNSGSSQYVQPPAGLVSALNNFTICAWVNLTANNTWTRVFDFGTGTPTNMFLTPNAGSGKVRYGIKFNGGEQLIEGGASLPTGSWQHLAVTLSGTSSPYTGVLYLNGVPAGTNSSMTLKPSSLGNTTQNYIGRSQYNDPYLSGIVDDFRIYSRALTAAELQALYYGSRTIVASASAGGSIVPFGKFLVNCGANRVFSAAANTGFRIGDILVDGLSQGTNQSYTFSNVTADHTIKAVFSPAIAPSLGIAPNGSGGLVISWPDTYGGSLLWSPVLGPSANWQPVSQQPIHNGDHYEVSVTPGLGARFYGLGASQ